MITLICPPYRLASSILRLLILAFILNKGSEEMAQPLGSATNR
jgi:hypothetical protein